MKTSRMTVLMAPAEKTSIEAKAAKLGVSSSEYVRLAVDNFDQDSAAEEAELAALVEEVNKAVPAMMQSMDDMIANIRETREYVARSLREAGLAR